MYNLVNEMVGELSQTDTVKENENLKRSPTHDTRPSGQRGNSGEN